MNGSSYLGEADTWTGKLLAGTCLCVAEVVADTSASIFTLGQDLVVVGSAFGSMATPLSLRLHVL